MCALVRMCASVKRRMAGQTHIISESGGKESESVRTPEGQEKRDCKQMRQRKIRAAD